MSAELLVRLSDEDLSNALILANKLELSIEEVLSFSLQRQVEVQSNCIKESKKVDQSSLMNTALHNAFMRDEGDEFSLIDLLGDLWSQVESPRAFGRHFRRHIESLGIGKLSYKTVENKAIYKRTDCDEEPKLT